ncbi:MAG: hypothetical protein QM426_08350 [Euryarchaeota archaeon]|nr:hypothetical protein [Euryarchaeota archaeon]
MKKKYIFLTISLIFILLAGLYLIEMNMREWRSDYRRYHYYYEVEINGLSGREVTGTTEILVPIPATKGGEFVITPSQKEPSFLKSLLQEYILHTPKSHRKGPYFENTTETLDNKSIRGNWTTFIAETEESRMLGFKTNDSVLNDISLQENVVADYIDIFDPISKNGPILYPALNISNTSLIAYGDQVKYDTNPMYESYVYISNNVENGAIHFKVTLEGYNDPTEWPKKYRGSYLNYLVLDTSDRGKIEARVVLDQGF